MFFSAERERMMPHNDAVLNVVCKLMLVINSPSVNGDSSLSTESCIWVSSKKRGKLIQ